jgi:uncharacterized membrane protein YphA (DoxX/SURF4 family)
MVALVFTSEGLQKFLYADTQGVGRFAKIGIPAPELMGPLVGVVETTCGALLLMGLTTRLAAAPLVLIMAVALASTKLPILLGRGYWIFAHSFAPKVGLWEFLHESRTDLALLSSTSFLTLVGGDRLSLDAYLRGIAATRQPPEQPLE